MLEQSPSPDKSVTKVAVLASSEEQRQRLQSLLQQNGLEITLCEALSNDTVDHLNRNQPDVMLVDIAEDNDEEFDLIDSISENSDIPMLLNDSGAEGVDVAATGESWARKLAQKLTTMALGRSAETSHNGAEELPYPLSSKKPVVSVVENSAATPSSDAEASTESDLPDLTLDDLDFEISDDTDDAAAINFVEEQPEADASIVGASEAVETADQDLNVWVLGASLGGPQAVRQFLSTIAEDLPVAFILAQHIGANHINLLAEQLNRVTAFTVIPGKNGHRLRHGEVILTPADKEISFTEDGYLALKPAQPGAIYSPSIDNVMSVVAKTFGEKAGTIVFSGMGDDGANGVEDIAEHNGIVWAQDIASCVVSSMPDHARKTGKVSFSATPEQLAQELYKHYRG